jgi:hypothetical protein
MVWKRQESERPGSSKGCHVVFVFWVPIQFNTQGKMLHDFPVDFLGSPHSSGLQLIQQLAIQSDEALPMVSTFSSLAIRPHPKNMEQHSFLPYFFHLHIPLNPIKSH